MDNIERYESAMEEFEMDYKPRDIVNDYIDNVNREDLVQLLLDLEFEGSDIYNEHKNSIFKEWDEYNGE